MCTYEDLVAATLPYGLAPLVVPQLKTITLGGAVTGLGIESTSFRNGLPHESVLEMDILTGAGEVLTASPDEHADLFRAFPNSYGTLGYSVRLQIELEPVKPFVALRHLRFHSLARPGRGDGPHHRDRRPRRRARRLPRRRGVQRRRELPVRWAFQTVDARARSATTPASRSTTAPSSTHDGEKHDRLTIHDYLWRWDTDWFWCSRAFGAQDPRIRRFWPRRYRRSSFYWKLIGYDQRFNIADRIEKRNGRPPPRARRPGHRGADRADRRVPRLVPGQRADRADLAVPAAAARRRRLAAVPDPPAPHLRQRRLLVVGAGRTRPKGTPTG